MKITDMFCGSPGGNRPILDTWLDALDAAGYLPECAKYSRAGDRIPDPPVLVTLVTAHPLGCDVVRTSTPPAGPPDGILWASPRPEYNPGVMVDELPDCVFRMLPPDEARAATQRGPWSRP